MCTDALIFGSQHGTARLQVSMQPQFPINPLPHRDSSDSDYRLSRFKARRCHDTARAEDGSQVVTMHLNVRQCRYVVKIYVLSTHLRNIIAPPGCPTRRSRFPFDRSWGLQAASDSTHHNEEPNRQPREDTTRTRLTVDPLFQLADYSYGQILSDDMSMITSDPA